MQLHVSQGFSDSRGSTLRLERLLGSGTAGTVYKAQLQSGSQTQSVAVKLPHAGISLRQEAAALRRFEHRNIIALLDDNSISSDGRHADGALMLELCDKGTLEDRLLSATMTAAETKAMVEAIADALSLIHNDGWIHGDVNPSNIGLRSDGAPALLDFGTCRPADGAPPASLTEEFSGTALSSTRDLDIRSLAATALGALGGAHPADSVEGQIAAGLTELITSCDAGVDVSLDQVCSQFANAQFDLAETADTPPAEVKSTPLRPVGGGPNRPRTRAFGPRPGGNGSDDDDAEDKPSRLNPKVAALVALLALVCLISIELAGSRATDSSVTAKQTTDVERVLASSTLERAGARWSSNSGSLAIEDDGDHVTFAPGRAGDHGAIADWNCDGEATLGVFRPSTGAWFTFDDWSDDAVSTVELISTPEEGFDVLMVDIDAQGCATPAL